MRYQTMFRCTPMVSVGAEAWSASVGWLSHYRLLPSRAAGHDSGGVYVLLPRDNIRRSSGGNPDLTAASDRALRVSARRPSRRRGSSAGTPARSRRSSFKRARITVKSSAARGRVTLPPCVLSRLAARQIGKLWLTRQAPLGCRSRPPHHATACGAAACSVTE